jgi:hypothetical protein
LTDRLTLTTSTPLGGRLTVDLVAVAWLAESTLDHIWYAEQDDDWEGCCPRCCAPCAALKRLLDDGQLDELLTHAPAAVNSEWWAVDHLGRGGVDREWLEKAWQLTACHCDGEDGASGPLSASLAPVRASEVAEVTPDQHGSPQGDGDGPCRL